MTPSEILKEYWGYSSFRPLQEEIIKSVLEGDDTMALLPTGGGKSICFQVPAMMKDGVCIVVSPLISLMKDQVKRLTDLGIPASCLVSGMNRYERENVLNKCVYGNMKLLYVSPERLKSQAFIAHLRQMTVSLIVVDEAHCISQWGYDFRPPYLEIANIRQYHPHIPILALTATATPRVVEDIKQRLQFRNGNLFQSSFGRPNVDFMVFKEEDKIGRLFRIISKVQGCGIIYVRNRKKTQEVASQLSEMGISAVAYHAGLSNEERDVRQQIWMAGKCRVVVATNAFGMGIDKPDVRFVIHLDIPDSPEAYYQEAGRAGRDGLKSYAVLLYSNSDLEHLDFMFEQDYPSIQYIKNAYRAICNYYQIPVGSGMDQQFTLDLEGICSTYGFQIYPFFSAIRFLEKEGLLIFPTRNETTSRLYVPINREELYRFQVGNRRYADLLKIILRLHGGLFTEFVHISEREIAKRCYIQEEDVVKALKKLDDMHIVAYQPKSKKPQIIFSSPRVDVSSLYLSDTNYKLLKERAWERIRAMRQYVESTENCRSRMLLEYFGEKSNDCGRCDVCRVNNSAQRKDLSRAICDLLSEKPMTMKELVVSMPELSEKDLVKVVRGLLDSRVLEVGQDLRISCKSSS